MTRRGGFLLALALAIIGAIGYWFYANFEKVTREVEVGLLGEARVNHLLAAQRFFESFGIKAESQESLTRMPPYHATLVIPSGRYEMGGGEAQRLRRWVESGGHLVLVPSAAFDQDEERKDAFLDPLGVQVEVTEDSASNIVLDVDWPGARDFMQIEMNTDVRLKMLPGPIKPVLAIADEDGVYVLRLPLGRGYVTVLADAQFMGNHNLHHKDNALFLWHVVQTDRHQPWRAVWLVFSDGMPPLPEWLMRHAWSALLSGTVLLLLWLWSASRRFGPLQPVAPLARRRLLDHIDASGRFLWRAGHSEQLLKGVRQSLYRVLELRHPAWATLSSHDLYERLAALSGLPYEKVQGALLYSQGSEHEFTQVIQTLERIRTSL